LVLSYGCKQEPLEEHKAKVIKFTNPKTSLEVYLNLPIDERPVRDYTVCDICSKLGIPVPAQADYMKDMHNDIKKNHKSKKPKWGF